MTGFCSVDQMPRVDSSKPKSGQQHKLKKSPLPTILKSGSNAASFNGKEQNLNVQKLWLQIGSKRHAGNWAQWKWGICSDSGMTHESSPLISWVSYTQYEKRVTLDSGAGDSLSSV